MRVNDKVTTSDGGSLRLQSHSRGVVNEQALPEREDMYKPIDVETNGWVRLFLRERGKIVPGSHREGHNIWTNTGREYSALHQTIKTGARPAGYPDPSPYRVDLIGYIGVGIGSQIEDQGVLSLNSPVAFTSGIFLAPIQSSSFPLTPVSTTVQYHRLFTETEISMAPGDPVSVSEMGLYTTGNPASDRGSVARSLTIGDASLQAPNAYKTFEPVVKRSDLELEIFWQIRF